ncbi:MAG TPA: hypothetical protein DCZ92_01810, partial [Elusimicrobia bacterium]|nr:hypothetical protein [Elusimicrobiota bacterium]
MVPREKSILIAATCVFFAASITSAETLNSQVQKIAERFTSSAASVGLATATIAVFPFEADERLSQKRVNFAVSELLTTNLLRKKSLQVIERAQLSGVLKEQRLGLSGAIDSKTASNVGQILGARLLALGNVVKMGNYYQITAKLVDSNTAKLITSEIIEVPIETFDKDAAPYLALVPKTQAIGIFITRSNGYFSTEHSAPVTYNTFPMTPRNPDGKTVSTGGGVRYWFTNDYMVEASYSTFELTGGEVYMVPISNLDVSGQIPHISITGKSYSFKINRGFNISRNFRAYIGGGILHVNAEMSDAFKNKSIYLLQPGVSIIYVKYSADRLNYDGRIQPRSA